MPEVWGNGKFAENGERLHCVTLGAFEVQSDITTSVAMETTSSCLRLKGEGRRHHLPPSFPFPKWLEVSVCVFKAKCDIAHDLMHMWNGLGKW